MQWRNAGNDLNTQATSSIKGSNPPGEMPRERGGSSRSGYVREAGRGSAGLTRRLHACEEHTRACTHVTAHTGYLLKPTPELVRIPFGVKGGDPKAAPSRRVLPPIVPSIAVAGLVCVTKRTQEK